MCVLVCMYMSCVHCTLFTCTHTWHTYMTCSATEPRVHTWIHILRIYIHVPYVVVLYTCDTYMVHVLYTYTRYKYKLIHTYMICTWHYPVHVATHTYYIHTWHTYIHTYRCTCIVVCSSNKIYDHIISFAHSSFYSWKIAGCWVVGKSKIRPILYSPYMY